MKIKLSEVIKDYDGKNVVENEQPLTYRNLIAFALNNFNPGETPTADQKLMSFRITQQIYAETTPDISIEDAAYIIERVGALSSPLAYGRVRDLFNKANG